MPCGSKEKPMSKTKPSVKSAFKNKIAKLYANASVKAK